MALYLYYSAIAEDQIAMAGEMAHFQASAFKLPSGEIVTSVEQSHVPLSQEDYPEWTDMVLVGVLEGEYDDDCDIEDLPEFQGYFDYQAN